MTCEHIYNTTHPEVFCYVHIARNQSILIYISQLEYWVYAKSVHAVMWLHVCIIIQHAGPDSK